MLKIYNNTEDYTAYNDIDDITSHLDTINILYVKVPTTDNIIEQIKYDYDVPYNDTIKIDNSTENYQELRQKFIKEHIHTDYEMRLFTHGEAKFFINVNETIFELTVGPNDLISVPAYTKHWFDAGDNPNFAAVRFFTNSNGWEAIYT